VIDITSGCMSRASGPKHPGTRLDLTRWEIIGYN